MTQQLWSILSRYCALLAVKGKKEGQQCKGADVLFDIQTIRTIHAFSICTQLTRLSARRVSKMTRGGEKENEGSKRKLFLLIASLSKVFCILLCQW